MAPRSTGTGSRLTLDAPRGSMFWETMVASHHGLAPQLERQDYQQELDASLSLSSGVPMPPTPTPGPPSPGPTGTFLPPSDTSLVDANAAMDDEEYAEMQAVVAAVTAPPVTSTQNSRNFLTSITTCITNQAPQPSRRGTQPKEPKPTLTTTPGPQVSLLDMSRTEVVAMIFKTLNVENVYVAGLSGPIFHTGWKGIIGGRAGFHNIRVDDDWNNTKSQLSASKVTTVIFVINVTPSALSSYLRADAPFGQVPIVPLRTQGASGAGGSAPVGTSVPTVDSYEPHTQEKGRIIGSIKAAHKCNKHGTCALISTKHGPKHCILSRARQSDLADYLLAHPDVSVSALPPSELMHSWGLSDLSEPSATRRGVSGPRKATENVIDMKSAFAEGFGMLAGVLAASHLPSPSRTPARAISSASAHSLSRSPSPEPSMRSSSPPPFEEELNVVIDRFVASQPPHLRMPTPNVEKFKVTLKDHEYDLQTLDGLTIPQIMEYGGLKEGQACGFKRSASQFASRVLSKRARRRSTA